MTWPGRLCVDIGHPHPDNSLVQKTFDWRVVGRITRRSGGDCGRQDGEMLDPQVCQAGG